MEAIMSRASAFKTPEGEAQFFAAYDAAMKFWPTPFEDLEIPGRFGTTHVVVCGPKDAPPLVLLHGYMTSLVMWLPNIGDFSKDYRVYAIDTMGQPSKSIPTEPIRDAADYVTWLTDTLNALQLDRVFLVGMSFGGWLALNFAVAAPERIHKLVLLSPGGLLPPTKPFMWGGLSMMFFPSRFTVNTFMRWLGVAKTAGDVDARPLLEVMYLGLKHFRFPPETARIMPTVISNEELQTIHVPVLLLIGRCEVMYDAAKALARARWWIPNLEGELVSGRRHDMCSTEHEVVDARVLEFLKGTRADGEGGMAKRLAA
jgi:pimeloyl-ACP methyl ester carboxylesterase